MPVAGTQPVYPPDPGWNIEAPWGKAVSDHVVQRYDTYAALTTEWISPPTGAVAVTRDSLIMYTFNGTTWVAYGSGSGSIEEVFIGPEDPIGAFPTMELWVDTDANPAISNLQIAYLHNQAVAATTWTINHPLSFQPNVTVVDSAGDQVEGDVSYPSATQVVVRFSAAFAGSAYLS